MNRRITRLLAALCASAMLLALGACGTATSSAINTDIPESSAGRDLTAAAAADNVITLNCNSKYSFNPVIATNHSNQLVCSLVYENMLELDNDFNVIPNLIYDWEYSEDGTTWVFYVDETHTFHDGTPVTSKDMRYSLERAINSDRYKGRFASVLGVSWDVGKLYVTLGIGNTQLMKLMNIPIIKNGSYGEDFPLGSGPYMYNEEHTQLLRFDDYKGPTQLRPASASSEEDEAEPTAKPITFPVDVIYLKEYPDAESIIGAFEDGLIDIVLNDPSSYSNLGYASTNDFHTYATTNMHYIACNEKGALTKYANFRYALNYAFDRSVLVSMLGGKAVAASVPMYPTCELYPISLANSLSYNIDVMLRILENAGIKDYDSDGRMELAGTTQDIVLSIIYCSDSSAKAAVVNRFASDMDAIGITVDVYGMEWKPYLDALEEGQFELSNKKIVVPDLYYAEVKLRNDFDLTEILGVRTEDNETTNINFTGSRDETYVQMIEDYLAAGKLSRADKYLALANYVAQNAHIIPIGFEKQELITRRSVMKGVNPNMGNPLYDFLNWTIITEE